MYIEGIAKNIDEELMKINDINQIVIWGAGDIAVRLYQFTHLIEFKNCHVVDEANVGKCFFGKIIESLESIEWKNIDAVIITPFFAAEDIEKSLKTIYNFNGKILKIKDFSEYPLYDYPSLYDELPNEKDKLTLEKNLKYKNKHKGERVFILCTGPSIAQMDLKKLSNERVIAVSRFYLHKDCRLIAPDYYCIPKFEREMENTVDIEVLNAICKSFVKSELFFNIAQKNLIDKLSWYKDFSVNYVDYKYIPNYEKCDVDLTKMIMSPQSVAILALQIAIYMGFDEIYLIGTEHDYLSTKEYKHFYEDKNDDVSKVLNVVDDDGNCPYVYGDELMALSNLWNQYKIIKKIAERKNIKIYNATIGGVLDVFERVDYDSLIMK